MVDIGKEIDHLAPLLSTAQELTWVNVGKCEKKHS